MKKSCSEHINDTEYELCYLVIGEMQFLNLDDDDPSLGALETFPTIYHARASWLYDINTDSLQKAILAGLRSLSQERRSVNLTIADLPGYQPGEITFKFGVGNGDGFDILDDREVRRVARRIEEKGSFRILDLVFHLHYSANESKSHRVHQDEYMARLAFQSGRVEILLHHFKGLRRISPDELVRLLLSATNRELSRNKYSELELESLNST